MKKEFITAALINRYTVNRKEPINFNPQDHQIFSAEWQRTFETVKMHAIKNAWIDSGGIIANNRFKIITQSLVNQRKPNSSWKVISSHFIRLILKKGIKTKNKYVWISERWSSGFFHWYCDALPRYFALQHAIDQHTVLLPKHYENYSYIKESLTLLDIPHEYIDRGTRHFSSEILFCDLLAPPGNFFPPIMLSIQKELQTKVNAKAGASRLFISRQKARIRKIINMDSCESILREFKFDIVVLEEQTVSEQIELVANADVLMGVHGAGLTNMLGCKKNCSIVELRGSQDSTNNCFFSLAAALDLDYYYFMTTENPTIHDKVGNVEVDIIKFRQFLSRYFPLPQ